MIHKFTLVLLIFLGGGTGTILRYYTSSAIHALHFPYYYATFLVNIVGSFIIGLITFLGHSYIANQDIKKVITIGILGGLTTFSGFSLDAYKLIESNQIFTCMLYVIGSVCISFLLFYFGMHTAKHWL